VLDSERLQAYAAAFENNRLRMNHERSVHREPQLAKSQAEPGHRRRREQLAVSGESETR
jgi:hypothetical protein